MQNRVSNMQRAWFLFSHSISLASGFFCCASLWHPDTSHASSTKSRCPCELHGIFSSNHYKQTPQATLSSPIPLWRWMQYCWVWSAPVFIAFMTLKPHEICTISSSFSSEINKKVKKKKEEEDKHCYFIQMSAPMVRGNSRHRAQQLRVKSSPWWTPGAWAAAAGAKVSSTNSQSGTPTT